MAHNIQWDCGMIWLEVDAKKNDIAWDTMSMVIVADDKGLKITEMPIESPKPHVVRLAVRSARI